MAFASLAADITKRACVKTHMPVFFPKQCAMCHTNHRFKPMWVVYNDLFTVHINGAIFRRRLYFCKQCNLKNKTTKEKAASAYSTYMSYVLKTVQQSSQNYNK